jgi:hypothetical protein
VHGRGVSWGGRGSKVRSWGFGGVFGSSMRGANSGRAVKRAVYRTVWDGRGTDKHRLQHRSQHRAPEPDPRQTEGEARVLPPLLPVLAHLR